MEPLQTIVSIEAFGARIGVRAPKSIASGLSPRLPPRARPIEGPAFDAVYTVHHTAGEPGDPNRGFEVWRDEEAVGRFPRLEAARVELESDMHFRVASAARDFLFVHAGVVEHEGRAIVIPGRTLAGKSSLVLALVRAGATYYSDEYAVVDPEGLIHPYQKPLSERIDRHPLPRLHPPESLGAADDAQAVPLGLTVITRYRPGARWDPKRGSAAESLMALFDNTVVARERPAFALELLSKAVASTESLRGDRSEAESAALAVLEEARRRAG